MTRDRTAPEPAGAARPEAMRPGTAQPDTTQQDATPRDTARADPARAHAARVEALKAHRRRGLRRLAVLLGAVLAAGCLAYLLLLSSLFGARNVDVVGAGLLTPDEVTAAAAVPYGRPLLRLDVGAVADRVRGLAPVAGVQVRRSWPATVTIRITERAPLAYASAGGGAQLVDASGLRFRTVPQPPPGLPELHAAEGEPTVAAATVLATLAEPRHAAVRAELAAVSAAGPYDIQLTLRGNRTVRWGSAEDSDRKAAVLAVLLSQRGTVYDVASPDLPTVR